MIQDRFQESRSGFTLIEVIVVIAVISILAGSMAPMISQRIDAAREDGTRIKMETLRKALLAYAMDTGRFPRERKNGPDSLAALEERGKKPPAGWRGPYLVGTYESRDYTHDAWNTPYHYHTRRPKKGGGEQVLLTSLGPDRVRRTKDDIFLTLLIPLEDVSERIARTWARLKLIEGNIYGQSASNAPFAYKVPTKWRTDAWGKRIRYQRYNAFSASVYSSGPNGVDDGLTKDDLYRALVWAPKQGGSGGGKKGCAKKKSKKCKKKSG